MNTETTNTITIQPPDADFVLIVSASPWLWAAGFALFLLVLFGVAALVSKKKNPEPGA